MSVWALLVGVVAGCITGWWGNELVLLVAAHTTTIVKNLLELVSLPVIFLSIVSSIAGMENGHDAQLIGRRVLRYTLLTTVVAALVGLLLFLFIDPAGGVAVAFDATIGGATTVGSYWDFVLAMVPSNLVQVFSGKGSVMAVVFVGLLFGSAILSLGSKEKLLLRDGFTALFSMMIAITRFILLAMPVAVWAFTALFVQSMYSGNSHFAYIGWYVVTIVSANVVQGIFVLPFFLWVRGIAPYRLFTAFRPALGLAFVSKSSNMTLPVTLECAHKNAGISERVARFCLPLCATINMNGCAAFILITVLFVARLSGMPFGPWDMVAWVLLASAAAIGNAGVPMGCFFLTSAFLVHLNLPLEIMGLILPMYALLDMIETALNVWSDACVTAVVDRDLATSHI